jgi:hypothetical protein
MRYGGRSGFGIPGVTTGTCSGYSGGNVKGFVVFTTVSAGLSSISDEFCSSDRYSGFAMNATKITIAIPAMRVRTSPVSTYYTGHQGNKKPP